MRLKSARRLPGPWRPVIAVFCAGIERTRVGTTSAKRSFCSVREAGWSQFPRRYLPATRDGTYPLSATTAWPAGPSIHSNSAVAGEVGGSAERMTTNTPDRSG